MAKSIIPGDEKGVCYICGRWGVTQRHHMMHGPDRKRADQIGLTVYLCPECHMRLHDHGDHDRELKQRAQEVYEEKYSRELWMINFGRNYREEK
nr:hypothetical protein [uncultured Eubacterium sp.]